MERYEADMIERQSGDPCRGYVYGIVVGPPLPEHLLEHKRQNGIPIMMVDEERVWCHGWYVPKAPIDKAKAKKAAREAAEAKAREETQGGVGGVELCGSVVVREGDGCGVGGDATSTGSSTGTSVSESAGGESEVENINQQVDMLVGCLGGDVGVNEDAWSVSPERIMQFVRNPLHFSLESHTTEFEVDGTVSAVVGGRAVSREDDNFFSDFDALIRDHEKKRVVESSTALGEMQAVLRTGVSGGMLLENRCRLRPMLSDGQNLEASRGAASVLDVPDIALNESYVQARTEQMLYSLFQKSTRASVSSGKGIGVDVRRSSDSTCLSSVSDNSVGSLRSILRMPGGVVEIPAVKGIGVQTTTTTEVNVGVREVEVGFSAVNLEHVAGSAETESSSRVLEFDCRVCGTSFTTRRARDLHVVEHVGVFACTFDDCKDEFASMQQLVEHLHNHAGRICEICQMTFEKNYNYNRHVKHHERALGCRFGCNRKFVYMRDKLRHERTHGGSLPVATCSCGCTFTRADNVKRHLVEVGEHVVTPTDVASESDRKKIGKALQAGGFVLKCSKCGRKFGRPYKYESHVLKCRVEAS